MNRDYNVVDFAYDIISMHKEINFLKSELKYYKETAEARDKDLEESRKHSEHMRISQIRMLLTPGVVDNLVKNDFANVDNDKS
jgi:hypothetical protein